MENNNSNGAEKKFYTAPEVTVYGDIEEITQATDAGPNQDLPFPHQTPIS
jgi:hypothetical protein